MWLVVACPKADISSDSMTEEDVAAHKLIAQFMSVSTKLEKYKSIARSRGLDNRIVLQRIGQKFLPLPDTVNR